MVDIKKDDDLAQHSPTLTDPRSPSPTLAPSFNLATLSTLATLAYTLHLADSLNGDKQTNFSGTVVNHDHAHTLITSTTQSRTYIHIFAE